MRHYLLLATVAFGLGCTPALAFTANPKFDPSGGASLECAIVGVTPKSALGDDPAYKVNVYLGYDDKHVFDTLNVYYTLVSGRLIDRTKQYSNAKTWEADGSDWYWKGTQGKSRMTGHLYHRDNHYSNVWKYQEDLFVDGKHKMTSLAYCHEDDVKEGDGE